jgi:hypothetical protein
MGDRVKGNQGGGEQARVNNERWLWAGDNDSHSLTLCLPTTRSRILW